MKSKVISVLFVIFLLHKFLFADKNPLEKIVITSDRAVCKKDKNKPDTVFFTYYDNVSVEFSDGSLVKSAQLEISIDTKGVNKKLDEKITVTKDDFTRIKKITFSDNVLLTRQNRNIQADMAEIFLAEKKCNLSGNVKIKQVKKGVKDLPIDTNCDRAELDLQTEHINFFGDPTKPVSTTIEIAGYPGLMKKIKTKQEKEEERKALRTQKLLEKKKQDE